MIRTRQLIVILIILIASVITTAVLAYYAASRMGKLVDRITITSAQIKVIEQIQPVIDNGVLNFLASPSLEGGLENVVRLENDLEQQLSLLSKTKLTNDDINYIEDITLRSESISLTLKDISEGNPNAYATLDTARTELNQAIKTYTNELNKANESTLSDVKSLKKRLTLFAIVIPAITLGIFFIWALPALYTIGHRIDNLNHSLSSIGRGAMGIRINTKGDDALASIEKTVNSMADALQMINCERSDKTNFLESEVARRSADLAAANERLRTIDDNRKAFIIELAHALKSPLTVARVSIENSANNVRDTKALSQSLNAVDDVIDKVKELLDLAQQENGLIGASYEELELYELLDNRIARFMRLPNIAKIELLIDSDSPIMVMGRKNELARLFDAVIENATEHTQVNDTITVKLSSQGDKIVVEIIDSGCGIADDERKNIFERYYSSRPDGTGIGLAMAKRIATEHHGTIEASEGTQGGTKITICLPKYVRNKIKYDT